MLSAVRISLRTLGRRPGVAALVVATLAIGIGATTAIFSVANALFLRGLPHVEAPERLVTLHTLDAAGAPRSWSWPNIRDAATSGLGLDVAALSDRPVALRGDGEAAPALALLVSQGYFRVLGVAAARGRLFGGDGADRGIVLSHRAWHRFFGGDPGVIGRTARVNGTPLTVIGVLPEGFGGTFKGFSFDVFAPVALAGAIAPEIDREARDVGWMEAFARLPAGMTESEASAALHVLAERLAAAHPAENAGMAIRARPLTGFDEEVRAGAIGLTAVLSAVALLVLAIACANVAGLLRARGAARRRELAVRMALGAGRRRLAGMLLLETGLLAAAGGALGMVLAWWAADALRGFSPSLPVPVVLDLSPDARVLAFAAAVTVLAAAAAGALPALRAAGRDSDVLRATGGSRTRAWRGFVVAQVAASLPLLVIALLFVRTLGAGPGPGFDTAGVAVAPFVEAAPGGTDTDAAARTFGALLRRIEDEPGVERAALASAIPLGLGNASTTIGIAGVEPPPGAAGHAVRLSTVTPGFFETLGVPLRAGRPFAERDRAGAPDVAVVSDAFARAYWAGGAAVGRRIERDGRSIEVVGVAADVRWSRSDAVPLPALYLPFAQWPARRSNLLVRERVPGAAAVAVRAAAVSVAPGAAVPGVVPLTEHIAISLLPQRIGAGVAGVLGGLGALLAGLGIYGLMAFIVVERRREIGIRLAIGAGAGDVTRIVLGQTARLAGAGVAAGAVVALLAGRALASMLHGVSPLDPVALGGASLLILLVAAGGCVLPLRRALRTAPAAALRVD